MTFNPAWGQDGSTYDGEDMRTLISALTLPGRLNATRVARARVMRVDHLAVTAQASPNNTVQVAAGQAVVEATSSRGAYLFDNVAAVNSPAISPTSTNPRIDLVIARSTAGVVDIEIVQGTPAGVPTTPAVPGDDYIILSKITIPASTTNITNAMLTDQRVVASAPVVICNTVADISSPWEGLIARESSTDRLYQYKGSAWSWISGGTNPTALFAYANVSQPLVQNSFITASFLIDNVAPGYDNGNNWFAPTGTYNPPETGAYLVSARMEALLNANERLLLSIFKNGGEYKRGLDAYGAFASSAVSVSVEGVVEALAGNSITIGIYTDAAGRQTNASIGFSNMLQIRRL